MENRDNVNENLNGHGISSHSLMNENDEHLRDSNGEGGRNKQIERIVREDNENPYNDLLLSNNHQREEEIQPNQDNFERKASNTNKPSKLNEIWKFVVKNRKKLLILAAGLILIAVLFTVLYFTVFKSNYQPLVFYRNFSKGQKHNYIKHLTSCVQQKSQQADVTACNKVNANMSFYISNITSGKNFFNENTNEKEHKYEFDMIETLLYFSNLTYSNDTDKFTFYGPSFNDIVKEGQKINSTDYENNGPIIKALMFNNGTLYKIFKPKEISEISWDYIIDSIKEFSPDLSKFLYDEVDHSVKVNSFFENNNEDINDPYYEKSSLRGSGYVIPSYTLKDQLKTNTSRTLDKNSYLDIRFPNNSQHQFVTESSFNKSSKNLDSVSAASNTKLKSIEKSSKKNEENYFNGESKYETDFTNENVIEGSGFGEMNIQSTTNMVLVDFNPHDHNTIEILYSIHKKRDYEEIDLSVQKLNKTKIVEDKEWESKIDSFIDPVPGKRVLLNLEDGLNDNIDTLKGKDIDIVYPIFQGNILGWKSNLVSHIVLKPSQDVISVQLTLTMNGLGNLDIMTRDMPCNLSGAIDGLVEFLNRAMHTVDEIIDYIKLDGKIDMLKKLEDFFNSINAKVKLPFKIEDIYTENIEEKIKMIIDNITGFVSDVLKWFKDQKFTFKNPLLNLTAIFEEFGEKSGINYLNKYNEIVTGELNLLTKNYTDLLSWFSDDSVTRVFEDMIDDTAFFEKGLFDVYNTIKSKIHSRITEDTDDFVSFLEEKTNKALNVAKDFTNNVLKTSQYSVALGSVFQEFSSQILEAMNSIQDWVKQQNGYIEMLTQVDKSLGKLLDDVENIGKNIIGTTHGKTGEINFQISKKIAAFDEIKPYEKLYKDFQEIYHFFYEFKDYHFSDYLLKESKDLLSSFSQTYLLNYFQLFYSNLNKIETPLNEIISDFRSQIQSKVNLVLRSIERNNEIVDDYLNSKFQFVTDNLFKISNLYFLSQDGHKYYDSSVIQLMSLIDNLNKLDSYLDTIFKNLSLAIPGATADLYFDQSDLAKLYPSDLNLLLSCIKDYITNLQTYLLPGVSSTTSEFLNDDIIKNKFIPTKDLINPTLEEIFYLSFETLNPSTFIDYNAYSDKFLININQLNSEISKQAQQFLETKFGSEKFEQIKSKYKVNLDKLLLGKNILSTKTTISSDNTKYVLDFTTDQACIKILNFPKIVTETRLCSLSSVTRAQVDSIACGTPLEDQNLKCLFYQEATNLDTFFNGLIEPMKVLAFNKQLGSYFSSKIKTIFENTSNYYDLSIDTIKNNISDVKTVVLDLSDKLEKAMIDASNQIYDFESKYSYDLFTTKVNDFENSLESLFDEKISLFMGKYKELFTKVKDFSEGIIIKKKFMDIPELTFIPDFIVNNIKKLIYEFKSDIQEDDQRNPKIYNEYNQSLKNVFKVNLDVIVDTLNYNLNYFSESFIKKAAFYLPKNLEASFKKVNDIFDKQKAELILKRGTMMQQLLENTDIKITLTSLKQIIGPIVDATSSIDDYITKNQQQKSGNMTDYFEFNTYEIGKEMRNLTDFVFGFSSETKKLIHRAKKNITPKLSEKHRKIQENQVDSIHSLHNKIYSKFSSGLNDYFDQIEFITKPQRQINLGLSQFLLTDHESLTNKTQYNVFLSNKNIFNSGLSEIKQNLIQFFTSDISYLDYLTEYNDFLVEYIQSNFTQQFSTAENTVNEMISNITNQGGDIFTKNNFDFLGENIKNYNNFFFDLSNYITDIFTNSNQNLLHFHNKNLNIIKDKILSVLKEKISLETKKMLGTISEPNVLGATEILGLGDDKSKFEFDVMKEVGLLLDNQIQLKNEYLDTTIKTFIRETSLKHQNKVLDDLKMFNLDFSEKLYKYNETYYLRVAGRNNSDVKEFSDLSIVLYDKFLSLLKNSSLTAKESFNNFIITTPKEEKFKSEYIDLIEGLVNLDLLTMENKFGFVGQNYNKLAIKSFDIFASTKKSLDAFKLKSISENLVASYTGLQNVFINNKELNTHLSKVVYNSFDEMFNFFKNKFSSVYDYISKMLDSSDTGTDHMFFMMQLFGLTKFDEYKDVVNVFFDMFNKAYSQHISIHINNFKSNILDDFSNLRTNILDPTKIFTKELNLIIQDINVDTQFDGIFNFSKQFISDNIITPIKKNIDENFIASILSTAKTDLSTLVVKLKTFAEKSIPINPLIHNIYTTFYGLEMFILEYEIKVLTFMNEIVDGLDKITLAFSNLVDIFNKKVDDFIDQINKLIDQRIAEFEEKVIKKYVEPIVNDYILTPIQILNGKINDALIQFMDYIFNKIFALIEKIKNKDWVYLNTVREETKYIEELEILEESESVPALIGSPRRTLDGTQSLNIKDIWDKITDFGSNLDSVVNLWKNIRGVTQIFETFKDFIDLFTGGINSIISRIANDLDILKTSADKIKLSYIIDKFKDRVFNIKNYSLNRFPEISNLLNTAKSVLKNFNFDPAKEYLKQEITRVKKEFMELLLQWLDFGKFKYHWGKDFNKDFGTSFFIMMGPVPVTMNFNLGFGFGFGMDFGFQNLEIYASINSNANSYVQASAGIGLPLLNFSAYIRGTFAAGKIDAKVSLALLDVSFKYSLCYSARFGVIEAGVYFEVSIKVWFVHIHWRVNLYGPITLYGGYQMNDVCPVKVNKG